MTEAHGDAEAVAIVRAFRDRALQVLGPDDELVKTIGDAVMLRFRTAEAAVAALRKLLQGELVVRDAVLLPAPALITDMRWSSTAITTVLT